MYTYITRVLLAISILLNTLAGGETNQTFSARNWYWKKNGWFNLVWLIDLIFFREPNHCQESYIKWLIINRAIQHYHSIGEQHFFTEESID